MGLSWVLILTLLFIYYYIYITYIICPPGNSASSERELPYHKVSLLTCTVQDSASRFASRSGRPGYIKKTFSYRLLQKQSQVCIFSSLPMCQCCKCWRVSSAGSTGVSQVLAVLACTVIKQKNNPVRFSHAEQNLLHLVLEDQLLGRVLGHLALEHLVLALKLLVVLLQRHHAG